MERAMSDQMRAELRNEAREQFDRVSTELTRDEPDMEIVRQAVLAGLTRLEPIGFTLRPQRQRNPDDVVAISRGIPEKTKEEEASNG